MSPSSPPIPNPIVVLREEFDDWAVLFNPDTAAAVGINPIGVAVWKLLDGKRNLEDIVTEIGRQYDKVPEAAREELTKFIDDLASGGYIGYEVDLKPS
jgi:SynChlorMet cassette protein ScmD